MTDYSDYEPILAIIEAAIDKARKHPNPGEAGSGDDFTAWVVLQELRRAGWSISRNPDVGNSTD